MLSPSVASVTATCDAASPFVVTITPASRASPARRKRGNAGRSINGRLVTSCVSPDPKRSSWATATAIKRSVVRLSGSLKWTLARPSSPVTTPG